MGHLGSGRFCSRKCAAVPGITKSHTANSSISRSERLKNYHKKRGRKWPRTLRCKHCGGLFEATRSVKNCGPACTHLSRQANGRLNGIKSACSQRRRSKNERLFAILCKRYFGLVHTNAPIFENWDADVVIPRFKLAVLWNGPWHRVKLTSRHSLKQVQTRDRLKIEAIIRCGFTTRVIEDHGRYNPSFVKDQFSKLVADIGVSPI